MLYVIKRHDLPSLPQGLVVATNSFYINDWTVGHSSSEKANTSAETKALTTYGLSPSLKNTTHICPQLPTHLSSPSAPASRGDLYRLLTTLEK